MPADAAFTGDVFQVKVALTGQYLNESGSKTQIVKQAITENTIINLALGANPTSAVPSNEVLAVGLVAESNVGYIFVLNTTTTNVLALVSELHVDGISVKGKGPAAMGGEIEEVGDTNTWALTGGILAFGGTVTVNSTNDHSVTSIKANVCVGVIQGIWDGSDFDVIITKGTVTTVRKLASNVELGS